MPDTNPVIKESEAIHIHNELEGVMPYAEFVKTTFAYTIELNRDIAGTLDLLHCTLGLVGEIIELENELPETEEEWNNPEKVKAYEKEIGDCCYYLYMMANMVNIVITPQSEGDVNPRAIEDLLDAVKKKIFYKHEVDLQPFVYTAWVTFKLSLPKPAEYYLVQNRKKLLTRYPEGKFNPEHAALKLDNSSTTSQ